MSKIPRRKIIETNSPLVTASSGRNVLSCDTMPFASSLLTSSAYQLSSLTSAKGSASAFLDEVIILESIAADSALEMFASGRKERAFA